MSNRMFAIFLMCMLTFSYGLLRPVRTKSETVPDKEEKSRLLPIVETGLNVISSQNDIIAVQVSTSIDSTSYSHPRYIGLFNIGTADSITLTFDFPEEPWSSHLNVKLDTIVYSNDPGRTKSVLLRMISPPLLMVDSTITCTWEIGRVSLEQRLKPVKFGEETGAIFIQYVITNNDDVSHDVGLLLEMDTKINENDRAPILTRFGYSDREEKFIAPNIPDFFHALEEVPGQPGLVAQGTLSGYEARRPDVFIIGDYDSLRYVQWDYTPTGQQYKDSAVILRWNQTPVGPTERTIIGTYYGTVSPPACEKDLCLFVSAPDRVRISDDQLSPNPFDVNLLVLNSHLFETAKDIRANILLPAGLELVSDETNTKWLNPSDLGPQDEGHASWRVSAAFQDRDTTLTFGIDIFSSNMDSNSISHSILIPSRASFILTAEPESRIVQAGKDAHYSIEIEPISGFAGTVDLSLWPEVPGITPVFSAESIDSSTISTLILQTNINALVGVYEFIVTGVGGGFTRSDTIALEIESFDDVEYGAFPNPFTPNSDGYNDYVQFVFPEVGGNRGAILIFDIWGRKVREISYGERWYGKDDEGRDLPMGVYLYVLKVNGKNISRGPIALAR